MEDEDYVDLKKQINNLLWESAPSALSLEKADNIACDILIMISEGKLASEIINERRGVFLNAQSIPRRRSI